MESVLNAINLICVNSESLLRFAIDFRIYIRLSTHGYFGFSRICNPMALAGKPYTRSAHKYNRLLTKTGKLRPLRSLLSKEMYSPHTPRLPYIRLPAYSRAYA